MREIKIQRKPRKIQLSKIQWHREWLKAVLNMDNIEARNDILKIEKARLIFLKNLTIK